MSFVTYSLVACLCIYSSKQHDLKGFDDAVLFDINFPGSLPETIDADYGETMIVTSSMQEKYKCMLPNVVEKEETKVEPYTGPSPLELILPLFSQGNTTLNCVH